MSRLALTLDLDGPNEYAAIYGLTGFATDPWHMYGEPLARFAALCRELGGAGTVFAIGRDVRGEGAAALSALARDGFEVACHSFAHDYRLAEKPKQQIQDDLTRAREVIAGAIGSPPLGFRAPGYNLSPALCDMLEELGFAYDSSALPSLPYYVAKALALVGLRALGRPSAARLGSPRALFAPRQAYPPGADPYRRGTRSLVELPVSVGCWGLPLVGDVLWAMPAWLRGVLARSFAPDCDVVVGLHAIDFADAEALPKALVRRHAGLRLSFSERKAILRDLLSVLGAVRAGATCRELAGSGVR